MLRVVFPICLVGTGYIKTAFRSHSKCWKMGVARRCSTWGDRLHDFTKFGDEDVVSQPKLRREIQQELLPSDLIDNTIAILITQLQYKYVI